MIVRDIVNFNRDNYYNGAVQMEWFYDEKKVGKIAKSYVFHGPKYYGVSSNDVKTGEHKLLDTASFTKIISDKLCGNNTNNNFVLTIAGYGTGKSHLAVTLGALFSGQKEFVDIVLGNIASVDLETANSIIEKGIQRNLVIALNGMSNFNLDAEVLKCVRLALQQNNISDEILRSITKTYDVARYFINGNFVNYQEEFEKAANAFAVSHKGEILKKYLLENIENDKRVVDIVNVVFSLVTGDSLHWDKGISAGDIILKVSEELCGEGKPFNKILILFDEFGRYIEYVAANPLIAGDASLQQIFEAVQSANGRALFVGFVQYELEAYLSHIDKSANVIRYVGRYSSSEKYYISSNFETILANLLEKSDSSEYEKIIGGALNRYANFHKKMHASLLRWTGNKIKKNVWTNDGLYKKVVMEGCYPLHPLTVWLLSNSSVWMQQRSTIAFCSEMYDRIASNEIEGEWLPYVYPVDIIDSGIYSEMLSSEEKGLVMSQNCMLYNEILIKVGEKLSREERQLLKAILIAKIGGFSFYDKEDAVVAFRYLSNLREEEIKIAIKSLEDRHGIIAYDDQAKSYDLIAEANGFNEFKRVFARYRTGKDVSIEDIDEETLKALGILVPVDTAFAQEKHISSAEWKFERRIVDSQTIDSPYLTNAIRSLDMVNNGEDYRGLLLYAYCAENAENEIQRLTEVAAKTNMDSAPIIMLFLDDSEKEIVHALSIKATMQRFSSADTERFTKHILVQKRKQDKAILQKFNVLVMERKQITKNGLDIYGLRLNGLCTNKFAAVYSKTIPFVFDGFENGKTSQARKSFITICVKMFDDTLMNIQSYHALNTADKNRIQSCISVGQRYSWQIFNNDCQLVLSQDEAINQLYREVDESIPDEGIFSVSRLFNKYMHAPYGMNMYAYILFVIYFIKKHDNRLICFLGNEKLTAANLSNLVFKEGKIKFSDFQRITIQRNLNADIDVVEELCKEILENADVDKCILLRKRLNDTLRMEGDNGKNQLLLGQSQMRLDDGDRLRTKLEERRKKASQILDDALAKMVIHKFISVFEYVAEVSGIIEDGLPYVYPEDYVEYMRQANRRICNYLDEPFYVSLQNLKCSDITQVGAFQNAYNKVVRVLKEHGYLAQAAKAEERVAIVVEETKARNQYSQAIGECEKDISLYRDPTVITYGECVSIIAKYRGWQNFIDDVNLPESIAKPLLVKLDEAIERINQRVLFLETQIFTCEDKVNKATTIQQLVEVKNQITELLEDNLSDDDENRLRSIVYSIEDIERKKGLVPKTIDDIETFLGNLDEYDVFSRVFKGYVISVYEQKKNSEQEWMNRNVVFVECNPEMDASMCASYMEKLRNIPDYISTGSLERVRRAEQMVTKRLHTCKVEGVVSLYMSLTEEEKEEFKRIISREC